MSDEKISTNVNNTPFKVNVEADTKYYWCSCGLSANQPFCDGSHKGSGLKSVHYTPVESSEVWLCCCQQTKNPPFCDGSHSRISNKNTFIANNR